MKVIVKLFTVLFLLTTAINAQTARLQVIHNSADPAAASVDIYLNGEILLNNFGFRTATPFIDAPAGQVINIGVAPGSSTSAADTLKNFQLTLQPGQKYVAVANGVLNPSSFAANPDGRSTAFTLFIKTMAQEAAADPTKVEFFVVHGSSDAPSVDVVARRVATLVDNAAYGDITGYIPVPAANYLLDVTPGNDNNTIVATFEADLTGLTGGAAAVFASGFLNPAENQSGQAFGIFAALPNGDVVAFTPRTTSRLQVIHNAADPAAASVDIYLNGDILLNNFGFRTATGFIDAPANQIINIGVAGSTSASAADTLKNFSLKLLPGDTYVAIANGVLNPSAFAVNPDNRNTAFTLFIKTLAREQGESSSNVDFAVVHGSTDAPAVDVIARGVATLVQGAAYSDITEYISVPASDYTLDLTPAGVPSTVVASFTAPLSTLGGGAAIVFASGFFTPSANQNGQAFGLYAALPDGTVLTLNPVTSIKEVGGINAPSNYELGQNYPNPFNPSTSIRFALPAKSFVSLKVFNVIGQEVATLVNDELNAGAYSYNFDAKGLTSGIYFYKLTAGNFTETRKMNLLK